MLHNTIAYCYSQNQINKQLKILVRIERGQNTTPFLTIQVIKLIKTHELKSTHPTKITKHKNQLNPT